MLTEVKADSEAVTTGIVYPAPSSAGEENLQNSAVWEQKANTLNFPLLPHFQANKSSGMAIKVSPRCEREAAEKENSALALGAAPDSVFLYRHSRLCFGFWLSSWLQVIRKILWSSTVKEVYTLQVAHWVETQRRMGFWRSWGMMYFPFLRTTVDLLEHWVPGGLCARAALGWILGSPAYCDGLRGCYF